LKPALTFKNLTYNMLMFQAGKLSTGDSLDMSPQDEASIVANDATVKDMEVKLNPSLITWGLRRLCPPMN
jgi:hypothetical protein